MKAARTMLMVVGALAVVLVVIGAVLLLGERSTAHPGLQPIHTVPDTTSP